MSTSSDIALTEGSSGNEPIFREINAEDPNPETMQIESACMNCFQTGSTRLLLTKIPFYKEVVLMSFKCEHCGYENNEIQSASEIQKKGVRITLQVTNMVDLNRRIVRSDYASINIPEVELEIPAKSQKGEITTVEGVIDRTIRGLDQDQDKRKLEHPDAAAAIDAFICRLNGLRELKHPFTVMLEDISGNSFIENPNAPSSDQACKTVHFLRSEEQDQCLGLYSQNDIKTNEEAKSSTEKEIPSEGQHMLKHIPEGSWPIEELHGEVFQFRTICSNCTSPCETNMKMTSIPHFKDVVIMATVCEICGSKTNEVKSGGGIEEKGMRFELYIENKEDLNRDVLKSETCHLAVPELECEVGPAALGGRFTTVEGILTAMKDQLNGDGIVFHDSSDENSKDRFKSFIQKFEKIIALECPSTLILDDPAGNSYVQSLRDDNEPDEKLKIEKYVRTFDQNEELGLNDIKTENY